MRSIRGDQVLTTPPVSEFDEKVGLTYLRGMHLNDSKVDVGTKRDRHENIGLYVSIGVL